MQPMETLTADPTTGLTIVPIPLKHQKYFSDLHGAVIHWFGEVDKYNRMWNHQRRIAIFTDQCIYLCQIDGGITRCVNIRWITEVVLTERTALGFKVGVPDYDMLINVENAHERDVILNIVSKVYEALVGRELPVTRLVGNTGVSLQQKLSLSKPKEWSLKIEPVKTVKALTKLHMDKKRKEQEDKRIVEEEFRRIKEGLAEELKRYRTEEFERAVDKISQYVKALEERDREIAYLKETRVDKSDPAHWRGCPNCAEAQRLLQTTANDDKQRIIRLERALEEQRHIVEDLQTAIQYRSAAVKQTTVEGSNESNVTANLRAELSDANRKNKELQQLILESPFLTSEIKQRAATIVSNRDGTAAAGGVLGNVSAVGAVAEKDREIRHLKSLLRDSTARHVQELEALRQQFKKYDGEIVAYLEKVFTAHNINTGGASMANYASSTALAARQYASGGAGGGGQSPANPLRNFDPQSASPRGPAAGFQEPLTGSYGSPRYDYGVGPSNSAQYSPSPIRATPGKWTPGM